MTDRKGATALRFRPIIEQNDRLVVAANEALAHALKILNGGVGDRPTVTRIQQTSREARRAYEALQQALALAELRESGDG